jgi:hypothetical protein
VDVHATQLSCSGLVRLRARRLLLKTDVARTFAYNYGGSATTYLVSGFALLAYAVPLQQFFYGAVVVRLVAAGVFSAVLSRCVTGRAANRAGSRRSRNCPPSSSLPFRAGTLSRAGHQACSRLCWLPESCQALGQHLNGVPRLPAVPARPLLRARLRKA